MILIRLYTTCLDYKIDTNAMSVLIRFCLIESFNIKVGKGYVLMRNLKVLVGTEDFLNRLELTILKKKKKHVTILHEISLPLSNM
jgi:hypothetical protein